MGRPVHFKSGGDSLEINSFVGRDSAERLRPVCKVIGCQDVREMGSELIVAVVGLLITVRTDRGQSPATIGPGSFALSVAGLPAAQVTGIAQRSAQLTSQQAGLW